MRLGCMWRTIQNKDKEGYFARARQADEEHRKKYPDYVYNPNVAREQKILRKKAQKKMLRHQSAKRRQSAKRSVSRAKTRRAREHQQAETTGGGRVTSSKNYDEGRKNDGGAEVWDGHGGIGVGGGRSCGVGKNGGKEETSKAEEEMDAGLGGGPCGLEGGGRRSGVGKEESKSIYRHLYISV
ncbi:sex-determining region Y protein-like [Zootermopsis nevadensis]|uniref:sex-determining region Y protein-like n=1 Tax=Zootermopsis nevadensis TaxID=136037 RepID=UPI000B8ED0C9|nr:sex-determining region Y protein-like [Zootermopsis nevadensis]